MLKNSAVSFVVAAIIFCTSAQASIQVSGPFSGDLQERFEDIGGDPFLDEWTDRFGGTATFRTTDPANAFIHDTGGWGGNGNSVQRYEGDRLGSFVGQGFVEIEFDRSISKFGGYFNSLYTSNGGSISFFSGNSLVATKNLVVNEASWGWQGWEATNGMEFDRLRLSNLREGSTTSNFLIFDALEASSSPIPEPGSLTVFGLGACAFGLMGFGKRRKIKKLQNS